eukprot:8338377-Alexandrium_andersonii.AAC.1
MWARVLCLSAVCVRARMRECAACDTDAGKSAVPQRGARASTCARERTGTSALNWAQGPETWA